MTAAEKLSETHKAFTCLALVKPRSAIDREWNLEKPGYCIFEFDPSFAEVVIRWGDGSWQNIVDEEQLNDLVLLHEFGEDKISELFD